jgi:uncharacterized protein (TIGR02265 family)
MRPFVAPDWNAPLDLPAYLAGVPAKATIKGVFPGAMVEAARRKGVTLPNARAKYHPFTDVPVTEYLPLLVAAAEWMFPGMSRREALRKVGRASFNAVEKSMLGRILLTGLLDLRSERRTVLHFSEWYVFLDSHLVGALEKVAAASKLRVDVRVSLTTPYEGDVEMTW